MLVNPQTKRRAAAIGCMLICALCSKTPMAAQGGDKVENWVLNPSFEDENDAKPVGWKEHVWNGEGAFEYASFGRTGSRSVAIASESGGDLSWVTQVEVKPFAVYRLSVWIKTENLEATTGQGALLNLHGIADARTKALTGTNDWTRVETVFKNYDNDSIQINCLYGGWGHATGRAWFDDVSVEHVSGITFDPKIEIDASKTREPISKYIYGQFIEHLGRCIYGGIWAEMLEDRKFFEAVGTEASPWVPIGGRAPLEMKRQDSYVGEQTPRLLLDGLHKTRGIAQGGLALRKGKKYTGRVVLKRERSEGPVQVNLVWGDGARDRQTVVIENVGRNFEKYPLEFIAKKDTDDGRLEITASGHGTLLIGTASLMPADNVNGMRADTLALLKQLDAPVYRWPGGNFVSGYDWKDGIGDPDRRPPRKNPAWTGIEHNDFGLDEFILFCRELGTEPYIAVNSGLGGAESAAEEVAYANSGAGTPMGDLRAKNGHPEPYGVKWWGVGNEMYGGWQLGHMSLSEYVQKHNLFAEAMRAVDGSIHLVGVGAVGDWSETMLAECADRMESLSEHFYNGEQKGLLSHVRQIPNNVQRIADAHREYRKTIPALQGKDIRIALDEWNYWYGPHLYGELGVRYFLRDALGVAAGLNAYARNSDIYIMANYAQTVNVIGCIKTDKTDAVFATTGLALKLYRHEFGEVPVTLSGAPEPLDVAAALTDDRHFLTVGVVNPTRETMELSVNFQGVKLIGKGRVFLIAGDDDMAYNAPGKKPQVKIEEKTYRGVTDTLTLPPVSVSLYKLEVKPN